MLDFLYNTVFGRIILKVLIMPPVSKLCGAFMDSRLSCLLIRPFVNANSIDLSEYIANDFHCFNDFFVRRIRPGMRVFDLDPSAFVSPCDGLLSVYEIREDTVIPVKQSRYSLKRLLHSKKTAAHFDGGYCLVFRLCVDNYHRYAYIDSGVKGDNHFIPGKLHTVQPVALEQLPVFTENSREYCVIKTANFGPIVQMEIGAMLVGRIKNHHGRHVCFRGEEKGYFNYGGSTVILLVQKNRIVLDDRLIKATSEGRETPVKMGEMIGRKQ